MHLDFCTFLILSLSFFAMIINADNKNDSDFVATNEWKVLKKGTPIPKGLHVRHNFETGITEVKLMDKESDEENASNSQNIKKEKSSNSLVLHPDESVIHENKINKKVNPNDMLNMSLDDLKRRLKKLKFDVNTENKKESKKFRSYEELISQFEDIKYNLSVGPIVLKGFIKKFDDYKDAIAKGSLNSSIVNEIIAILNNLEYLIHQIDNAQLFADLGGMSKVISPCLNSTNNDIKSESLRLLGAAVQSNPKVQMTALENDYIQKLLFMITVTPEPALRSRCLFALSALVRQFPLAQKTLMDHGGLEVFGKTLDVDQPLIQTRIMKLVSDLIIERRDIANIENESQRVQLLNEYKSAEFEKKLLLQGYCQHLSNLMNKSVKNIALENTDKSILYDDLFETIFESMISAGTVCHVEFKKRKQNILDDIEVLIENYKIIEGVDKSDQEHFINLLHKLRELITEEKKHDEL